MIKNRKILLTLVMMAPILCAHGQESATVFSFLNLPSSAHTTALGGKNISLVEDDISLSMQNPALLSGITNRTVGLDFMTYMKGSKAGSASYAQTIGERGAWGAHAQFVGYGSITETLANGEQIGSFSPLDLCLSGQYSYVLTDHLAGGATGKFIYSHYGEFTSCALAVDLGLNYYLEDEDFSLSATARNLGGQVKSFADHHEKLPFDLDIGFTKGLGHAPLSISLTMVDLTRWSKDDYYTTDGKLKNGRLFMNHFILGFDINPSKIIYISGAYNFRRSSEMKAAGSSHAAGLSFGAGLKLQKFKFGLAYAKYHVGAPTLSLSLAYNFDRQQ